MVPASLLSLNDNACYPSQLIVSVDSPMIPEESALPLLSDDVVGFVAKHIAQFCLPGGYQYGVTMSVME